MRPKKKPALTAGFGGGRAEGFGGTWEGPSHPQCAGSTMVP